MLNCTSCQAQLLDLYYGLLDDAERAQITAHLADCSACSAADAKVQMHRQILSAAAKASFTEVRFTAPLTSRAASLPMPKSPPVRRRSLTPWAVAASVLLVLSGLGTALGVGYASRVSKVTAEEKKQQELHAQAKQVISEQDRIQNELRALQEQIQKLEQDWQGDVQKVRNQSAEKDVQIEITGPKTVQAGAPNKFQIETRRLQKGPLVDPQAKLHAVPSQLTIRAVDVQSQKMVFKQVVVCDGSYGLVLPQDLPVKPGSELRMEVLAQTKEGKEANLRAELPLTGPLYLTHLMTDRPMYRPGEKVFFRSLTLERFSLKPAQEEFQFQFVVTSPQQAEVFRVQGTPQLQRLGDDGKNPAVLRGPDGQSIRGIGSGEWQIPSEFPGGEYTLTISDVQNRFPAERRKFLVNRYQAPRLNKELEFTRKSYGPGETAVVNAKVALVEGGRPIANQPVIATASVDGRDCKIVDADKLVTDAVGTLALKVQLPEKMERGLGTLSLQFTDGANRETLVRPIPIALSKLFIDFFPEGGDLVAGLPNRVYFQAKTNLNKPAELKGRIVDGDGKEVAQVQTLNDDKEAGVNQGMGLFEFTPVAGMKYELKIDAPQGITSTHPLPNAAKGGVVLRIPDGVFTDKLDVTVTSAERDRKLLVGAYCRGRMLDHASVAVEQGKATKVSLKPADGVAGVYRVTVFEEGADNKLIPITERLVYRRPTQQLKFTVEPDKAVYSPGEPVTLKLKAANENDKATAAIVAISVVDQSILKLADEKTARAMPTHFFLTTEVRQPEDLEYADFLVGDHARAAAALDLLLGTQGWRRFAEQMDPRQFRDAVARLGDRAKPADADRLLLTQGLAMPEKINSVTLPLQRVDKEYAPKYVALQTKMAKTEVQDEKHNTVVAQEQERIRGEARTARAALALAQQQKQEYRDLVVRIVMIVLFGVLVVLTIGGVLIGSRRLAAGQVGGMRFMTAGLCSLLLLGFVGTMALLNSGTSDFGDRHLRMFGRQQKEAAVAARGDHNFGEMAKEMDKKDWGLLENGAIPDDAMRLPRVHMPEMKKAEPMKDEAPPRAFKAPPPAPLAAKGVGGMPMLPVQPAMDPMAVPPPGAPMPMPAAVLPAALPKLGEPMPGFEVPRRPVQIEAPVALGGILLPNEQRGEELKQPGRAFGGKGPAEGLQGIERFAEKDGDAQGRRLRGFGLGKEQEGLDRLADGVFRDERGDWDDWNKEGRGAMMDDMFFRRIAVDRELRKQDKVREIARMHMGLDDKRLAYLPAAPQPMIVREYAHKHTDAGDGVRRDFSETVCWIPVVILQGDKPAEIRFDLSEAVTRFQVQVVGHGNDGRLGAATSEIASRLPFSVEPKVPVEVTHTDKIKLPVTIANDTEKVRTVDVTAQVTNLNLIDKASKQVEIAANKRVRQVYSLEPSVTQGEAKVRFAALSQPFGADAIERTFKIVPEGFPIVGSKSDLLEKTATHTVKIPESMVKGTLKLQVEVFPSTLADLQRGLEQLLREPNGCFEQTSSSNYPNIMILSYLKESDQANPAVEQRARTMLASGYGKLTSFECLDPEKANFKKGYEWFGGAAPAHEALTAYGLLQFKDMAGVAPVDKDMMERTQKYLLDQRDGQGGFKRNQRALDSFGRAPADLTNAYILWALTSFGNDDVSKELSKLLEQAKTSKDPYFLSLVALSLLNRGQSDDAIGLLKTVQGKQSTEGAVQGAATSITASGGRDLEIETTGLALLAWLKANRPGDFNLSVQKAAKWIGQQRGGHGGFGSTQSTILALKALIAFTRENRKVAEDGDLILFVNDKEAGRTHFSAGQRDGLVLHAPEAALKSGDNVVRVEMTKNTFPFTLTWSYNTLKPNNAEACPVEMNAKLDRNVVKEGETLNLKVKVENKSGKDQGMAVAVIGLPGGLSVPPDMRHLKDMCRLRDNETKPGLISAFEIRGRELVLYWRAMAKDEKIEVELPLIAQVPGEYRGPASRSYLYYNADNRFWIDPLAVTIRPE